MNCTLADIVHYTDRHLRLAEVADYPGAFNGLQLEAPGPVRRIIAAVDACEAVVREAVKQKGDLLIVHHGMFWSGAQMITGAHYRKLRAAMDAGLAIYSAHLPLDLHPVLGNNAQLARALGLRACRPFFHQKGQAVGLRARVRWSREELAERLAAAVGGRVHVCPGGPAEVREIGLVTGGAGAEVAHAAAEGVDTFITGEAPHWAYPKAEELGVNLLLGGHYATETFGVKALAAHLAGRFGLEWQFVDHPTGL